MGGISRTVKYKGNRIDIGGHRFLFEKRPGDELVAEVTCSIDAQHGRTSDISYHGQEPRRRRLLADSKRDAGDVDPAAQIPHLFPAQLLRLPHQSEHADTLWKLGLIRTMKIGFSYLHSVLFTPKKVENLEDFSSTGLAAALSYLFQVVYRKGLGSTLP